MTTPEQDKRLKIGEGVAAVAAFAFLNRFRGSSQKVAPKLWVVMLMALLLSGLVPLAYWNTMAHYKVVGLTLLDFVLTTLAIQTGHSNFIDLGTWLRKPTDGEERLEFIIKPLYGKIPEYWYDFIGCMLTGVVATLPSGLILLDWETCLLGLFKGPCYALGRIVSKTYPVEMGEVFFGAVLGCVFAWRFQK